jgi:hypothetical protein
MRATVRNALIAVPSLVAVVPTARWYSPGNVIDNPVKPFVVLRWLAPVRSESGRELNQLRVDVHDNRGSYARIDQFLGSPTKGGGVYDVLSGLLDHTGVDGRITECSYLGHSGDQEDDSYLTNFKFSSWQVIGVDL